MAITARYFLAELDSQTELLRFLVPERKQSPQLLSKAVDELIAATYQGFADWLRQVAGDTVNEDAATTIANLALGSLLSSRLLRNVIGVKSLSIDDEAIIPTWTLMVMGMLPR